MSNESEMTPAQRELEASLRQLEPSAPPIDLVACAYEAGARSARSSLWMWRSAAGVLALAVGVVLMLGQPSTAPPIVVTQDDAPPAQQTLETFAMETRGIVQYLRLRDQVLDQGLDALPAPPPATADFGDPPRAGGKHWRPS